MGVAEEDEVVIQVGAICNRDVGVPDKVVGKQDGADNN